MSKAKTQVTIAIGDKLKSFKSFRITLLLFVVLMVGFWGISCFDKSQDSHDISQPEVKKAPEVIDSPEINNRRNIPTQETSRIPYWDYYNSGKLEKHDPVNADPIGLEWQLPLDSAKMNGLKIKDLGGAYCPTMSNREKGSWSHRYKGIHRGHDLGVNIKRLKGKKIPVQVVADGIYDGQREYTHAEHLPKDCKPLVVYHHSKDTVTDEIYTSIYCHVDPRPELRKGEALNAGDTIGYLEDPEGSWNAHVHLEIYTRPVYASKDSTKFSRCGCSSNKKCDNLTLQRREIPRGCGIFEDDRYILEPVLFIKKHGG